MNWKVGVFAFLFLWLDLIFAQEVKFDPNEGIVAVGQVALVRCYLEPQTQAPATYHWYDKQGNEITQRASIHPKYVRSPQPPLQGKELYIEVTDDDKGRYRCKVVVGSEEYEGYFQLNTYAQITVDRCPTEQHGTKTQDGKITCVATAGDVNLMTYWEREGLPVRPEEGSRYFYATDASGLEIKNISDTDKGYYRYVAKPEGEGPLKSLISPLRMDIFFDVWTVPVITKPVLETNAIDGGNVTLYCEATGYPTVQFRWYKATSEVRDTGRIKIRRFKDQSQLQFEPVRRDDESEYKCVASNGAGSAESSTRIEVHIPPTIEKMDNVTASENNGVSLRCRAFGDPQPRMEWVRVDTNQRFVVGDQSKGTTVSSRDIIDEKNRDNKGVEVILAFKSIKHEDAGNYQCEALNLAGDDKKILNLEVLFGPRFDQQPDEPFYNWKGNKNGYLPCVVSANPLPLFQWTTLH